MTANPTFLVVDDDADTAEALRRDLSRRFGVDYQIRAARSVPDGLAVLEDLCEGGEPVAMVIADLAMPCMSGVEFLVRVHELHPEAGRALLLEGFNRAETEQVAQAAALGQIDTWIFKPWQPADLRLHPRVCELLAEWTSATGKPGYRPIRIVAEPR